MSGAVPLTGFGGRVALLVERRALGVLALLVAALAALVVWSLMTGSYGLGPRAVLATLAGDAPEPTAETVVWEFRLPRTLVSAMVGALLALSGATLQTVTRNALADPSLVGVSQGASLAVVASIVAFPGLPAEARPLLAFGGGLAVAALIQAISLRRGEGGATMRFILTGIGLAAFLGAITTAMLTYGRIEDAMAALGWLAGSVHAAGWGEVRTLALCLALLAPLLLWASRPMAPMRMGAEMAAGLGVRVGVTRAGLVALSVALAAVAVAAVGPLGFVGLVAPHMARRLARAGVGLHLLLTAAVGALMVLAADLVGRALFAPVQIPAGLVTALLGAPVFVWLILRAQARSQL